MSWTGCVPLACAGLSRHHRWSLMRSFSFPRSVRLDLRRVSLARARRYASNSPRLSYCPAHADADFDASLSPCSSCRRPGRSSAPSTASSQMRRPSSGRASRAPRRGPCSRSGAYGMPFVRFEKECQTLQKAAKGYSDAMKGIVACPLPAFTHL